MKRIPLVQRILLAVAILLAFLLSVLLVRTGSRTAGHDTVPSAAQFTVDSQAVALRLAEAIRIATITDERPFTERAQPFTALQTLFERHYPRVHAALPREVVGGHSLLFTWAGRDSALPPILLMGHMDVVPVVPGSENDWTHPPFSGALANGEVWGRGALDDKQHVVAILSAAELLLAQSFQPARTVLLFFGHDEEGAGTGAQAAAALLATRYQRLQFVLDEGGIIGEGMVPGVGRPVALVKVAEKTPLTLELLVRGAGGHSLAPPRPTPVGILAHAIAALEEQPFPARLEGATKELLTATAGEQDFLARLVLRNLWLFAPLVKLQMSGTPGTDATIRTTIAPTMLQASPKDNVLPIEARAAVNFRVLPGQSLDDVIGHVRRAIDDSRVEIRTRFSSRTMPASDPNAPEFALVRQAILQVAPGVLVAPFLLTGATDSRYFAGLSDNIYGFSTARAGPDALERAHGSNERIRAADVVAGVRFYAQIMRNAR